MQAGGHRGCGHGSGRWKVDNFFCNLCIFPLTVLHNVVKWRGCEKRGTEMPGTFVVVLTVWLILAGVARYGTGAVPAYNLKMRR